MYKTLPSQLRSFCLALAAIVVSAGLLVVASQSASAFHGCHVTAVPATNAEYEARVAQLVNQERAARSLPPLKAVGALGEAARYHAADLATDDYFAHDSHDRSGGNLQRVCGTFERISLWYSGWIAAAENIAAGYNTPEAAVAAWMNSDGHRNNILSGDYTEFGVGYYGGAGEMGSYWVQDFGARGNSAPMILAGESSTTTSRNLDVYVHGKWSQIRLRNDNGSWTEWRPFANSFSWTIGDGRGLHVVSAEIRNGATLLSSCDTIMLDVPATLAEPMAAPVRLYLPTIQTVPPPSCG